MFRNTKPEQTPFAFLFSELAKPDTSDERHFPPMHNTVKKGRFKNIFSRHDETFPHYNANVVEHGTQRHILLEGPAQNLQEHSERFLQVLINDAVPVTDVIAAGDPHDGRKDGRGYFHYFGEKAHEHFKDHHLLEKIGEKFHLHSKKDHETGSIVSYNMRIKYEESDREIRVHHIPNFGDFKSIMFSIDEIHKLLDIFQNAETLVIHCSAGMGRTGVIELAYCLFRQYEKFYPQNKPDFLQIKLKLNELRLLRPALLQAAEQYRMAVILGMALNAASCHELSEVKYKNMVDVVDAAALAWKKLHTQPLPASDDDVNSDDVANEVSENSNCSDDEEEIDLTLTMR